MKRSVLLATALVVLSAPSAFAQNKGRGIEVGVGLGRVNAQVGEIDATAELDMSGITDTIDYATDQLNTGNQTSVLNLTSGALGELSGTAASIGNSFSLDAAARVTSDLDQMNLGHAVSVANASVSAVGTAAVTAASIGNSASVTATDAVVDADIAQANLGSMTATVNGSVGNVSEATLTAASIGNSLSVEIPGSSNMTGNQFNSGTMVAELNGSLGGFSEIAATAASIGNSASLTSLNTGLTGYRRQSEPVECCRPTVRAQCGDQPWRRCRSHCGCHRQLRQHQRQLSRRRAPDLPPPFGSGAFQSSLPNKEILR
jgi:hypothetical protein